MYRFASADLGYASVEHFMIVTAVQQLLFGVVCMPMVHPLLLQLLACLTLVHTNVAQGT